MDKLFNGRRDGSDAGQEPTAEIHLQPLVKYKRGRSNRQMAAAAGISERHYYRLIKQGLKVSSPGAERLFEQLVGGTAAADMLIELGCADLIGTEAHRFLDRFIPSVTRRLASLHAEIPTAIEVAFADQIAALAIKQLRHWYLSENVINSGLRDAMPGRRSQPPCD